MSITAAIFVILIIAAFFTAFYMGRQLLMVFFGKARSHAAENAVESPAVVTLPLVILAVLSALGGLLNFPGLHWLEHWLEHTFGAHAPAEFVLPVALGSLAVALTGLLLAWAVYGRRKTLALRGAADPLARSLGPIFNGHAA